MSTTEIVVGLEDSPSARAALRWAARHARITRSVLRGVHVDVSHLYDEIEDAHRASITAVFDEIQPPADWHLQFASGDARHVLVRESQNAQLLVVGTREHVGLGRVLAGSISHYCLSHAVCPIVAVPAELSGGRCSAKLAVPSTAGFARHDDQRAVSLLQHGAGDHVPHGPHTYAPRLAAD
jgi:nucleotide-binding universal stress UspA family protein